MRSDLVFVTAIVCLTILGVVSAFKISGDAAKIIGGALTIIAGICGVAYHFSISKLKEGNK
jgi:hypothetical protein